MTRHSQRFAYPRFRPTNWLPPMKRRTVARLRRYRVRMALIVAQRVGRR